MSALAPSIPTKLYREVISNLGVARSAARRALLSLALASKHLLHESQRVLFSSNDFLPQISKDSRDVVARHHQFVQTIFNYPARFGPYVKTFVQVDEENVNGIYTYGRFKFKGEMRMHERLRELTLKTLPYLISLKSLVISSKYAAGPAILPACDFQLEVLQYLSRSSSRNDCFLSTFLPNQHGLLLISVYPVTDIDQWSVLVINGQSLTSNVLELPGWARGGNIIALTLNSPYCPFHEKDKRTFRDELMRLKYLILSRNVDNRSHYRKLRSILDGTPLNIELLELYDCSFDPFEELFAPLSKFNLLSFRFILSDYPQRFFRMFGEMKLFRRYTRLQRVLLWDDTTSVKLVYSRPETGEEENAHQHMTTIEYCDDESNTLDWEESVPAKRMSGMMWWRRCYL